MAIQHLPPDLRVLECGTVHRGEFVLICEGSPSLEASPTDSLHIVQPHPELLKGYFKQLSTRAQKNLVCLEEGSLCRLIEATNTVLMSSDFQLIEISRQAYPQQKGFALFANGTDLNVFHRLQTAAPLVIVDPSENLQHLF